MTPHEAAFEMEQLDHDFYLFRELVTGLVAVIAREGDGYRLTRLDPRQPCGGSDRARADRFRLPATASRDRSGHRLARSRRRKVRLLR